MKESRTSKVFKSMFKARSTVTGGYIGSHIKIPNNSLRESLNNESKLRNELQMTIKNMIQQKKSAEEIIKFLNQDKYKAYEQYLEIWIQNWIIKLNPDIKSIITKSLNKNIQEQEIMNDIQQANYELYEIYKEQIQSKIKAEIQARELAKKREKLINEKQEKGR